MLGSLVSEPSANEIGSLLSSFDIKYCSEFVSVKNGESTLRNDLKVFGLTESLLKFHCMNFVPFD